MPEELKNLPTFVSRVTATLENSGFEAYVVGGCVRDTILGKQPKDWDITSNATPEQIQGLFVDSFYTNEFGTVGVVDEQATDERLKVVEVTTYRTEEGYSDARRPDTVRFSSSVHEDLERRDFTMNAIAYRPATGEFLDLFGGVRDLSLGEIRAVGDAQTRFTEDALRLLRAVRLMAELNFTIEAETEKAIFACAEQLQKISKERIRDEFVRMLESAAPRYALEIAQKLGLLRFMVPELEEGIGMEQNQAHAYTVFEHNMRTLQHAADKNWPLIVRLAALFHDIGKPAVRAWSEEKQEWTFHGHEVVGARMTKKRLQELKFPKETTEVVVNLVRWHMFFSDPDKITLSAVRRIIVHVGREHIENLINLRICDRVGTGRPKEQPFRLRKYQAMIAQALRDPISVGMLVLDGKGLMELTGQEPGPRVGWTLHALLEDVLDDASRNTREYLETRAKELAALSDEELRAIGESGKDRRDAAEAADIKDIERQFRVV